MPFRITKRRSVLVATIAALLFPAVSKATPVVYSTPGLITADTDVVTTGQFLYAYTESNVATSVNGVSFAAGSSLTLGTDITLTGYNTINNTAFVGTAGAWLGLSTAYQNTLKGAAYVPIATSTTGTTTLNNLVAGHSYITQFWAQDARATGSGRNQTMNGANTVTLDYNDTNANGGSGQYTVGQFLATGTTQALVSTGNAVTSLNAIQVRDVTGFGAWTGASADWDQSTTATNFATNFYTDALTTNTNAVAGAFTGNVTFGDSYWANGSQVAVTTTNVNLANGGITSGNAIFQNNSLNYTVTSSSGNAIGGTATIAKTGTGALTLLGPGNNSTGSISIGTGTLQVGDGVTDGSLGTGTIFNSGVLNIKNLADVTLNNTMSGTGSLDIQGPAVVNLGGTSTYTGGSTITGATTINLNTAGGLGTGPVNFGAATLNLTNTAATTYTFGAVTASGPINVSLGATSTTAQLNASWANYTGTLNVGNGTAGGKVALTNATSAGMTVDVKTNATFFSSTGVTHAGSMILNGGDTGESIGQLRLEANTTVSGNVTLAGNITGTNDGTVGNNTAGNIGYITGNISETGGTRNFSKVGAGIISLGGTNSYTGTTTVLGGVLLFAKPSAMYGGTEANWTSANLIANSGATLGVNIGGVNDFSTTQVNTLLGTLTTVNNNGLKAGSSFGLDTTNATGPLTFSTVLQNSTGTGGGAIGYNKLGTGVLILDGANTYTGTTTVTAGTLRAGGATTVGVSGPFGLNSTVNVLTGATLDLNNFNTQLGALTGGGSITLGTAALTIGGSNGAGTFTGVISGTGSLTKTGTGTQIFSTASTYSGGTTINTGTIQVGAISNALGSGMITVNSGATLLFNPGSVITTYNTNNSITVNGGTVAGADGNQRLANGAGATFNVGALGATVTAAWNTKDVYIDGIITGGAGALNIAHSATVGGNAILHLTNNNNTYSGTVNVSSGVSTNMTASVDAANALQFSTVNLASGTKSILQLNAISTTYKIAGLTGNGVVQPNVTAGTYTLNVNNATDFVYTGAINNNTGVLALLKTGAGKQTLGGTNNFTGTTTVNAGTLALDYGTNNTSKLADAAVFTLSNSTLELAGGATGTHVELVASTTVAGASAITRNGLNTAKIALGALTANAGSSLEVQSDTLATTTNTNNAAGYLTRVTRSGLLAMNDGSNNIVSYNAYTDVNRLGGTIADGAASNVRIIEGGSSGSVTLPGAGTTNISSLSNAGNLGLTTVDIGSGKILRLGAIGTIANASDSLGLAFTNGTLTAGGVDNTAGELAFFNSTATPTTISSTIANNGTGVVSLSKAGSGTLTINSATLGYTGTTTVSGGTLEFGSAALAATANKSLAGTGTILYTGLNDGLTNTLSSVTITGTNTGLTSSATLIANSTRLAVDSANDIGSANLVVTGNGQLYFNTAGGPYTNNITISGIGWGETSGSFGAIRLDGRTLSGSITLAGNARIGSNNSNGTISGVIGESGGARQLQLGGATANGTSRDTVITLSGANTYTGGTLFGNATSGIVTVNVANNAAFSTGSITVSQNSTIASSGAARTIANPVSVDTTKTLSLSGAGGLLTMSGNITGAGGVTGAASSVTLSGTNSYTGVTTVNGGTLTFTKPAALYNADSLQWTDTNLVVNSGATAGFNIGGTGEFTEANINALAALGTATGGFKTGGIIGLDTTNAAGATFTFASALANPNGGTNALGLNKLGTGTLILTADSTYSGTTTVSGGILQVGNGGATGNLGSGGNVSIGTGGVTYNLSGNPVVPNKFTSGTTGTLTWAGAGTLTLSNAANGFGRLFITTNGGIIDIGSGNTTIAAGGGNGIQYNNLTGTGTINATGGGTLTISNGDDWGAAAGGTLVINAKITGVVANTLEIYNPSAGTTGLTVLTNPNNDYAGPTAINLGRLSVSKIGDSGVAGNLGIGSVITIANTTALIYTGTGESTNRVVNLSGTTSNATIEQAGTGLLKFTNSNTAVAGAKTLTLTGSTAGTGEFSGSLINNLGTVSIAKTGTGTWSLSGSNSYTGTTTVTAGVLEIASTGTINTTSAVTINGGEFKYNSATTFSQPITFTAGKLSGVGTIGTALTSATGTTIAPGNSAGNLTFANGVTMSTGGVYQWELGALSTDGTTPGQFFDMITVAGGNLALGGTSGLTLDFGLLPTTGPNSADTFWTASQTWKIIDVNGSGTNSGDTNLSAITNAIYTSGTFATSVGTGADAGDIFLVFTPVVGGTSVWQGANNDPWTAAGSWTGSVPNSTAAEAKFITTGGTTANLDANQTVNKLTFDSTAAHTISGPGILTLGGTTPSISTAATNTGSETVAVTLNLAAGTTIAVNGGTLNLNAPSDSLLGTGVTATVATGATLSLGGAGNALSNGTTTHANVTNNGTLAATTAGKRVGNIDGTGTTTVTAAGANLTASHVRQAGLTIGAGNKVTVAVDGTNSGTSVVTNLSINATGKLDLNDNDLVVDGGNLATLTAQLASGLDVNGTYGNGPGGITSTAFATNPNFNTVLGIAPNSDLAYSTFSGQTVDANDVLIKYTYYGDADLNGLVDAATDFDLYITGLTSGGSFGGWLFGDFDYNGTVDAATDFDLYITGLTSQGAPLLTAGGGSPVTAIPEPSTLVLAGLGVLGFAGVQLRRRRSALQQA